MNAPDGSPPGLWRLFLETLTGRRPVETSGPLLNAFLGMPGPVRDLVRWLLRPRRRFLFGRLRALADDRVMSGPFRGMRLAGYPAAPELLGCYERELFPVVQELASGSFDRVINVGARYGYYAIGFARLLPAVPVIAFEAETEARRTLAGAAAANGVADRVRVRGYCDVADLIAALAEGTRPLLVCDIEGGEMTLLDPARVSALRNATILVECHGSPASSTELTMAARFLPSHQLRRVATEGRVLAQLPEGVAEPWRSRMPRTTEALMQENRTVPQSWLLLTPRASSAPHPSAP
ncbi:MAG TPA: hypothetical protein VGJ96_01480 [Gemmatimonadaceae bacterium]